MRGRFQQAGVVAITLATGSCIPDVTVDDPSVQLLCDSDDDCPESFACKTVDDEQRCIALSVLSKTPLELTSPLSLDQPRVSAVDGNNVVTARFAVSEQPAAQAVLFDDAPLACIDEASDAGVTFTCTFVVADDVVSGVHTVTLRALDAAGNSVRDNAEVVVDTSAPNVDAITVLSGTVREDAAPANASLALAVAFDEPIRTADLQLSDDEPCEVSIDANTVFCTTSLSGVEGGRRVAGSVSDLLGNVRDVDEVFDLVVDATPPAPPDVNTPAAMVYRRAPWGAGDAATPSFTLEVAPGAVEPDALIAVAADGEGRAELAVGAVGTIALGSTDHSVVFVAAVDRAGNRSPFVAVREQQWTATLGNKRGTRRFENPHQVFAVANHGARLFGNDTEVGDAAAIAPGAAGVVTSRSTATWTEVVPPTLPVDRRDHCQAFDAARGEVVVFGGSSVGAAELLDETWVYAGGEWQQRAPSARPGPRRHAACAYDPLRDRVVLVGGEVRGNAVDEIWEWDGTTWSLTADRTPAPTARAAAAFSVDELAVVVVGGLVDGLPSNQVLLVDTSGVRVDADVPFAARVDAAAVTDNDGHVVVFGGDTISDTISDTWRRVDGVFSAVASAALPPRDDPPVLAQIDGTVLLINDEQVFTLTNAGWQAQGLTTRRPGARFTSAGGAVGLYFGGAVNEPRAAGLHWQDNVFTPIVDGAIPTDASADVAFDALTQTIIVRSNAGFFLLPERRTIAGQSGDLVDGVDGGPALLVTDDGTVLALTSGEFLQQVAGTISPVSPAQVVRVGDDLVLVNNTDTWRLPESTGTWVRETSAPAVTGPALAALGDRVLMIGGRCGLDACRDAQVLESGVWTSIPLNDVPPRLATAAVTNTVDNTVLFFGGLDDDAAPLGDLWQWDGTSFVALDSIGPAARGEHAMAFIPDSGEVLLVGGAAFGQRINDVWSYDTARDARPALRVAVSVVAAQLALDDLVSIDLNVDATNAAATAIWQAGAFVDVGGRLEASSARRALVGDEATLHVVVPAATTGPSAAVDLNAFAATFSFRSAP